MTEQLTAEASLDRLASALIDKGTLSADWVPAFQAVPRHWFVPDTIWPGRAGGARQTVRLRRSDDPDAWWGAVYSDVPITTQWNDGAYDGPGKGTTPTSSSSMPTMVFSMLDALDVHDGQRVLEVGTGTGWNAALLCHRVGARNVVSVEVDEVTAAGARARLEEAGYAPHLLVGDGLLGCPERAPFDRVIATAGVGRVPSSWIAQTRPGGVIVAPWGPEYGGEGIVRLTVGEDGSASGRFVGSSAFMRIRQQRVDRPLTSAYLQGGGGRVKGVTWLSPDDIGDWPVMFAIGVQVPGVFCRAVYHSGDAYTLWILDTAVSSWAAADFVPGVGEYEVVQAGPRRLWDEVEAAWRWWDSTGRPGVDRFGLTVRADGRHVAWLDEPGRRVPSVG